METAGLQAYGEERMLILTRRLGDVLYIKPQTKVSGSDSLGWFSQPISVRILKIEGNQIRVGIEAASNLLILRGERERGG